MPRKSKKLPESLRKREVLRRPMRFRVHTAWSHPIPHQHLNKLTTIFQHYGLDPGKEDWQGLALKLLADYVPGFQFIAQAIGRPSKWTPQLEMTLVKRIDRLRKTGLSVRQSCEVIGRSEEFRIFGGPVRGPSPGTLELEGKATIFGSQASDPQKIISFLSLEQCRSPDIRRLEWSRRTVQPATMMKSR